MDNQNISNPSSQFDPQKLAKFRGFLMNNLMRSIEESPPKDLHDRVEIKTRLEAIYTKTGLNIPDNVLAHVFKEVLDEVAGYGPIQVHLDDERVDEVMVNGPNSIYVEVGGKLLKTKTQFVDDNHVLRVIDRIILPLGRRVDRDSPTVDARLPDGSRVNAIIPPIAIDGPSITIRKFKKERLTIDDLIKFGSLTEGLARFLKACVAAKLNIVISGGTGSGKTSLLNILSGFIPETERIITIEDAAELQLNQDHVVRLETKPANLEGKGEIHIRELVRNSLRMRPDRIVVGECRGGEALDMLQAMNTGHDGSLTTVHSNSPRDAIARLETLALMAGLELPIKVIREQIAAAIDLIIQQSRFRDGTRKITAVTEVAGMEGNIVVTSDIFMFEQTGIGKDDKIIGHLKPTGIRPIFSPRLEAAGFKLSAEIFGAGFQPQDRRRR